MTPSQAAELLAKISAYDRRTVGETDAAAWAEALDGLVTLRDAQVAVRDHFRESAEWLMPVMVIDRARLIRAERMKRAGVPDIPQDLSPADERRWLTAYHEHLARTDSVPRAARCADDMLGVVRVDSTPADPEVVRATIARFVEERAARAAISAGQP